MRKLLLLLITLCLHIAARGQTFISLDEVDLSGIPQATSAKALRYWFDDGASGVQTTTHLQGQHSIDASTLTDGLHTLHYQIVDNTDVVAIANSVLFLKTGSMSASVSASQLRYWFDDNDSSVNTVNGTSGFYMLNGSSLTEGLHTLHYQAVDTQGTASIPRSTVFLKYSSLAAGISAKQLRYWFDDDTQTVATVAIPDGIQTIDAHEIVDGLHTLHYQVIGVDGVVYNMASALFLKMEENNTETDVTARMLMYWFDDDTTVSSVELSYGVQVLDASSLVDGLHTIHYQVLCSNGQMTSTKSTVFLRMNIDEESSVAQSLRYWFDDQQTAKEIALTEGVQLLDVSAVEDGLHTVHYQIADNKGVLASPVSSVFLKMDSKASTAEAKSLRYWFDDNATSVKVVDVTKGSQALDVSGLVSGLHTLYYQLIDADGKVSSPVAYIFMRDFDKLLADGKNAITRYQYWLNANSEAMETVELSSASNPYSLLALLPMQKEPIRTQQFRFEVTDGQPTIYAENTFNIRFHDATGYFADAYKPFVDYSVKQEVTDAEWLESGIRQTTAKPVDNEIRWYMLEAEPGDSVQFRLDRAATIQLFSPSGVEVLKASGADVVNWYGKHVRESGTYYLALHDVTATYGNTISIDYNHIDKYAVLRQDVSVVGNGGCSTITFEGNGFRDLYAVSLFTEKGDSIHHIYIGHESDAETSVVFDFTDVPLGTFHAKFRFAGEDKVFNNLITVEVARDIELATTVTYPATFLRGTSTTFTIKIENKGNMTAYAVPVEIQLLTQSMDAISEIDLSDNAPSLDFSWANENEIPSDSIRHLLDYIHTKGDMLHFINVYDSIDGRFFKDAHFAIEIAPHSTYVLSITIKSRETIELQTLTPSKWYSCVSVFDDTNNAARLYRRVSKEGMCCVREKVECVMNVIVGIFDFASIFPQAKLSACIASLGNTTLQFAYDVWCGEELGGKNKRKAAEDLVWDAVNGLIGCLIPGGKKWQNLSLLQWVYQHIYDNISITMDCVKALTKEIPNCPPNPNNGGGSSTPVASVDPNDIYGYTAESGSHAVKDGLTDVYYRIEFENDTTFATAPAHDIWLTDTLDTSKFDLSSFTPTRIKIGEKMSELSGDKNFVQTVDLRPEVNAIAQIEGTFDEKKGIARWHISSLDPMTMEPTKDVMDGVLPVNTDGRGIGELSFDVKLKDDLAHGTEIKNRAGIVFDQNDVIMTPTWTNVIDRIAPESRVTNVEMATDSTAVVKIAATDELSGPWRYDVYVQYGTGSAWFKAAENVPIDTTATVKVYEGIDHGFYVVVTDSAGNVEQKNVEREFTLEVFGSQVDTNTRIDLAEGWNWMSHNQQEALALDALKPKAQRMVGQTEELFKDARFGWMGDLEELLPTQMYKVQMAEAMQVQLGGRLFNAGFRSVPLYQGWNWIGYPVANAMTPAEALAKLEAEEGDMIIGQDGMATFADGAWTGTLTELTPGQGYMYRSVSDKNLFYNATAQASARQMAPRRAAADTWSVDKRKYPNVMGIVATLSQNGSETDANEWIVAAFCGDEFRGVAQAVNGVLMMNVYGTGSELISFYAMSRDTEEVMQAQETEDFRADVLGTMAQPYQLNVGQATGITTVGTAPVAQDGVVYDLQGRRIGETLSAINAQLKKGVYIVTDGSKRGTNKVVRK